MLNRLRLWIGIGVIILVLAVLQYFGYIWHNSLFTIPYEIKGLDISHHQGKIDWPTLNRENDFRFINMKATEGSDFTDKKFKFNWENAKKTELTTGAYHFFSMSSSGQDQAAHFIRTVPKVKDSLPPVVDVEIHLGHNRQKVKQELQTMLHQLEQRYQKSPVLYVTYDTYNTYVKGDYEQYPIWIRDIFKFPLLAERDWTIWQYTNRGRISGIKGYVDINVFHGNQQQLRQLWQEK